MVGGDITQAELDEVRTPLVSGMRASEKTNAYWVDVMSGSYADAARAPDILSEADIISAITLDEVKKAAKVWLSKEPIVVLATPKAAIALNEPVSLPAP
jgi:predicted Zn-dependent peptidase